MVVEGSGPGRVGTGHPSPSFSDPVTGMQGPTKDLTPKTPGPSTSTDVTVSSATRAGPQRTSGGTGERGT